MTIDELARHLVVLAHQLARKGQAEDMKTLHTAVEIVEREWGLSRTSAQAIEAGTAETVKHGSVHESAVAESDVPTLSHISQGSPE